MHPALKTRDATRHDATCVTVQIRAHTDAPSLLNTTREHPLSFSAPPTILRALAFVLTADDAVPDALRVAVAAPRAAAQVPPQKPHRVGRGPPRRTFFFAVSLPQFCILPAAYSSVSASSSPFAPSVVLASSPTERAHIRYQSSPIHAPSSDYVICARDVRDEESAYTHPSVYPSAKYAHAGYAPARLPPPARSAYGYGCTVMSDALEPPSTSDIDLDVSDDGDETFRGVDNDDIMDMDEDFYTDPDFLSQRRRLSFLTSAERETPFRSKIEGPFSRAFEIAFPTPFIVAAVLVPVLASSIVIPRAAAFGYSMPPITPANSEPPEPTRRMRSSLFALLNPAPEPELPMKVELQEEVEVDVVGDDAPASAGSELQQCRNNATLASLTSEHFASQSPETRVRCRARTQSLASSPLSSPPSSPRIAARPIARHEFQEQRQLHPIAGPSTVRHGSSLRGDKVKSSSSAAVRASKSSTGSTDPVSKPRPRGPSATRAALTSGPARGRDVGRLPKPAKPAVHPMAERVPNTEDRDANADRSKSNDKRRQRDAAQAPARKRPRLILSDTESEAEDADVKPKTKATASMEEGWKASHTKKETKSVKRPSRPAKAKADGSSDDEAENDAPASHLPTKTVPSKPVSSPPKKQKVAANGKACVRSPVRIPTNLPLPYEEMQGMLIETLATSRASSLPASSLYNGLIASRPALKESASLLGEGPMTKKEWTTAIEDILEAGCQSSGVFGKVESNLKVAADHEVETQWFYVPEKDEDQERATLIKSMMPRPGKRSETKKSKQYYWRPLGKISRWDPEDDL
ncbi:hypothetical protein IEO21_02931 [Rhodonia placenta]|uniref:Uncharacterized protein n=1 Tax=Rhodonia placenta TaxID=104341 RepID=A0A8H7U3Z1_9APHY|nr:hypothetical protein IEO21_02931 [Postia placenta]